MKTNKDMKITNMTKIVWYILGTAKVVDPITTKIDNYI